MAKLWAFYPPVGVFIALLALLAVLVPLFRDLAKMGKRERAFWTVVMFALMLLEIKSIYQDRKAHDQEQAEARQTQLDNFKKIGDEITLAIQQNQQNFNTVMTSTKMLLAANLGGDSFCIMTLEPGILAWKNEAVPMFAHKGKYPLYGVNAQVIDDRKLRQLTNGLGKGQGLVLSAALPAMSEISVGDIPSGTFLPMWGRAVVLQAHDDILWHVIFTARNGSWREDLRVSFTNGQWAQAVVAYRMDGEKRHVLYAEPKNVDWDAMTKLAD